MWVIGTGTRFGHPKVGLFSNVNRNFRDSSEGHKEVTGPRSQSAYLGSLT